MKTKLILLLVLFLATIKTSIAFQEMQDHKVLFEKAKYTMETKADLKGAIDLFERLIIQYPNEKEYVAKSLLYQGMCYEKLGNQEAVKKYQKLVSNYPGQQNEVAFAKERLSKLVIAEKDLEIPAEPKFTKINIPTNLPQCVALSPDGKNLALVSADKLWKMPLSGNLGPDTPGIPEQINTEGVLLNDWSPLTWSLNGEWIAFNGNPPLDDKGNVSKYPSIYVVSSDGGNPKKVIEINRDEEADYSISLSTDGNMLAFSSVEENKQHIFSTPMDKVIPRQLVEMESREPVFSPDGKYIAFVEDKDIGKGWNNLGLWVVEANGGKPFKLADADRATSPIWSPDGKMIAFYDASLYTQISIVPFSKTANTIGKVIRIDAPAGNLLAGLAGWTHDNKIGVSTLRTIHSKLYTMPVEGGQAVEIFHRQWAATQPRWSKNGKQIYFVTSKILESVSASGGESKQYKTKKGKSFNQLGFLSGNRVSPDGKWIVTSTWTKADKNTINVAWPTSKIWKLSVDGEDAIQVTNTPGNFWDSSPCWSADGKKIAFVHTELIKKDIYGDSRIYLIDSNGGEPELLDPNPCNWTTHLIWSPDGKMIAYTDGNTMGDDTVRLKIIDIESRDIRVIEESLDVSIHSELVWSPDSKRIAFNDAAGKVIKIMNIDDGSIEVVEPRLVDARMVHLDWSPDGKRFVFGTRNSKVREFWFMENFLPLEKLAQNNAAEVTPKVMTNKKIWNESDTELEGAPSPDGKYISYVDWETGDLAIYEIATGKKRRLTNKGSWDESNEFALMSRWSPDGKQMVYDWKNRSDFCELRITDLDGSKPRILYSNKEVKWTYTYDWSSDGKQILTYFDRKKGTDWIGQMVLVSVADGSEHVLKTTPITESGATGPDNLCFSTDGRYIIYDVPQKEGSPERDIFMMSSDGNFEIPLVEHPAHDELLACTPDGKYILFASDRNGTFSLWKIKIAEGKPQGNPELVKSDMGTIEPLGFTREGSYYYGYSKKNNNIYTAELDPKTGEILAQPKKTITRFEGYNQAPSYSPDGKYLAYVSRRFPLTVFPDYTMAKVGGNVLCIKSLETGDERELFPDINRFRSPRWSLDGLSVFVIDMNNNGGSKQIDIQTGNVTTVLHDDNKGPQPTERSHDGKTIYYVHQDRNAKMHQILVRNLESGTKKEIYRSKGGIHIRLSPDGQWLAIQENYLGWSNKAPTLNIMPSAGGEIKELCRFEDGIDIRAGAPFTWTPDGKYILYAMKSPKKEIEKWDLYRIPAKGGEPEKLGMEMSGFLMNLSIHPDGRHIAFSITEQSDAEIWVMENFLPKEETVKK